MLEAQDVHKNFARTVALGGVTVRVERGQCVAIVGESGSGKTTLLRTFNRLVDPDSGRITVDGVNVATTDPVVLRRSIGYVPQDGGLLPHWRVLRNVALVPWLTRNPDAEARAREALRLVGLDPDVFSARWPGELSGGQRQRVAIARALAGQPAVLLLDEAFSALDAITRADVHDAFLEARSKVGLTTLMVTHDLREAARLADRMIVLRQGSVEQDGVSADIISHPATPYVAELVQKSGFA